MPDSASAAHGSPTPAAGAGLDGCRHRDRSPAASAASTVSPLYRLTPFGVVRCPVCELVFVSPRLSPSALQRLYDEPAYFEGGVYGDAVDAARRRWCCSAPGPPVGWRTIGRHRAAARLGCWRSAAGTGCSWPRPRRAGYDVRGVELSRTGAEHARQRLGLDVFCGQLADAPADPADVVCFWDTLEHVPDPLEFLRRGPSPARPGRGVRPVGAVLLVRTRPAAAVEVVDAQARATHLALHPGHPAAGRRPGGLVVTSVITVPLRQANAGRTDSLVAVGRAIPGAGSVSIVTRDRPARAGRRLRRRHRPGTCHRGADRRGRRVPRRARGADRRDDPCLAVHRPAGLRSLRRRAGLRRGAAVRVRRVRPVFALPDGAGRDAR